MRLNEKIENGVVRIDFDPSTVKADHFQEIYKYLLRKRSTSRIAWTNDAELIQRGILIGYYNVLNCDARMAKKDCVAAINFVKSHSIEG